MYRVVKDFFDLQDSDHFYKAGDVYPRDGLKVGDRRIEELITGINRQRTPLIEKIEAAEEQPAAVEVEAEPEAEPEVEKAPEKAPAKTTRKKKNDK